MTIRSTRRRSAVLATTAALALSALAACGSGGSSSSGEGCQDGEIKIGALLPLSGPAAGFGQGVHQSLEFAVSEVNADGGLEVGDEKCKVTIVDYDTKGTAEQASTGMNKLISQGVKIVWGPNLSQELTAVQEIAKRNEVLVAAMSYASTAISEDQPLAFAMATTPSGFAGPLTAWVAEEYPDVEKLTIVVPDNQGGKDTAGIDEKAYNDVGIEAAVSTYAEGTTDFAPFIDRLLRDNPDAVDLASTPPGDAGVVIKQLRQAGFEGPIGRVGGEATTAIIAAVGDAAGLGEFYFYAAADLQSPEVVEYLEAYTAEFGEEPLPVSVQLLPSARLLLKAIDEADSTDTTKVAETLADLPIDDPTVGKGTWGGEDFYGINHEVVLPFYAGRYQNGQLTLTPLDVSGE